MKNFPHVLLIPVVYLDLRLSLQIFVKIFNDSNIIFRGWGKMIHGINIMTLSLYSKTSAHIRMHWYHFIKLYKNTRKTISWDYPFKSIFTAIIVSTKSWPPPPKEWRSVIVCYKQIGVRLEGDWRKSADGCHATFDRWPNSSESEKAWSSFNL